MDNSAFLLKAKSWINNKLILSQKSDWYKKDSRRSSAIAHVKEKFATFLLYPTTYSVHQLALLFKRHEDLLMTILPVPNNPGYETAFKALVDLLKFAHDIIEDNDLKHML